MIRHYLPLINLPVSHHPITEQLKQKFHIVLEEYEGRNIDHVYNGIKEIIIRVPSSGYVEENLIFELYKIHLRYIRKMNLTYALVQYYYCVPLLRWNMEEHLFVQLAEQMEYEKIYKYFEEHQLNTDTLSHLQADIRLLECDISAMEKAFGGKPSAAIVHRFVYHYIILHGIQKRQSKNLLFRMTLINPDLSLILDAFCDDWKNIPDHSAASNKLYTFALAKRFMQDLSKWNLLVMLCN